MDHDQRMSHHPAREFKANDATSVVLGEAWMNQLS